MPKGKKREGEEGQEGRLGLYTGIAAILLSLANW